MTTQNGGTDLRDRSLADLLRELSQQTATLVRQEMELAKAELRDTGKRAGAGAGLFGAGGAVGYMAFAAFTAFLVLLLNEVMPVWLAALIVAVVYGVIAGVLALQGRNKVKEALPPAPQTTETVKEDIEWAKHPTRSVNR